MSVCPVRIAFTTFSLLILSGISSMAQTPQPPYLDPSKPIEIRVDDLISRMTLVAATISSRMSAPVSNS